jgi:hypothetical protein
MHTEDRPVEPGSELDLAIERALEAANLRAGDAAGTSSAFVLDSHEPSAAEMGDGGGGADGD